MTKTAKLHSVSQRTGERHPVTVDVDGEGMQRGLHGTVEINGKTYHGRIQRFQHESVNGGEPFDGMETDGVTIVFEGDVDEAFLDTLRERAAETGKRQAAGRTYDRHLDAMHFRYVMPDGRVVFETDTEY